MAEIFDHIDQLRRQGGRVAIATLVNTQGTTPRKEGAKMLVGEGGAVLGSVTIGGCVDARVIEEATDVLSHMRPQLIEMNLGDEGAWEVGLTCGGAIAVLLEPGARGQAAARAGAWGRGSDERAGRSAALRHPRTLPGRRRVARGDPVRADPRLSADGRDGPRLGRARLQVRPAGAAPRAGQ